MVDHWKQSCTEFHGSPDVTCEIGSLINRGFPRLNLAYKPLIDALLAEWPGGGLPLASMIAVGFSGIGLDFSSKCELPGVGGGDNDR